MRKNFPSAAGVLPEGLEKRIATYGAMAVAAALGGATPANAAIIVFNGGDATTLSNGSVTFNMVTGTVGTSDTGMDFALRFGYSSASTTARAEALGANGIGLLGASPFPARLAGGANIGGAGNFLNVGILARRFLSFNQVPVTFTISGNIYTSSTSVTSPVGIGDWQANRVAAGRGYLGLQFLIGGLTTHYGWADITVNSDFSITLHGFAYESCADQSIDAGQTAGGATCDNTAVPEPHSAVLLAMGAAGIAAYRRRRKAA